MPIEPSNPGFVDHARPTSVSPPESDGRRIFSRASSTLSEDSLARVDVPKREKQDSALTRNLSTYRMEAQSSQEMPRLPSIPRTVAKARAINVMLQSTVQIVRAMQRLSPSATAIDGLERTFEAPAAQHFNAKLADAEHTINQYLPKIYDAHTPSAPPAGRMPQSAPARFAEPHRLMGGAMPADMVKPLPEEYLPDAAQLERQQHFAEELHSEGMKYALQPRKSHLTEVLTQSKLRGRIAEATGRAPEDVPFADMVQGVDWNRAARLAHIDTTPLIALAGRLDEPGDAAKRSASQPNSTRAQTR